MCQKCELTEELLDGSRIYGIAITCKEKIYEYRYISYSKQETAKLISQIAGEDIAPVHYGDIVKDYIVKIAYDKISANGIC